MKTPVKLLMALGTLLVCCCFPAPSEQPAGKRKKPTIDILISAGDSWWFGSWLPVDSPASIRDSVQMWSDLFDIKRVYWRGQQEEMMIDYGVIRKENLLYHEFFEVWERFLMKDLKLNGVLVDEAHKRNMEVYLWAPLFDYGGPADYGGCKEYPYYGQLKLTIDHPDWMPVDRFGIRRYNGPIELCYPEARKALIEMYLHYIKRDKLDGITFFTYAENYGLRFEDEFGFNEPIVEEYKRRYGLDIRTQGFDKHLWRYLRGEYVTQFLRELKAALKPLGRKLGVRLNPREPNYPDRWNVSTYLLTAGRIYLDWERWVREGILDEIVVSGSTPKELQHRTIENVMQAVKGTKIEFSCLVGNPFSPRFEPYTAQGMRMMCFGTEDASYINWAVPEQPVSALKGKDIYPAMRELSQVIDGKAKVPLDDLIPLTRHQNILMRRLALKAVSTFKSQQVVPLLEAALDDPERSVRTTASFALAEVNGPQTVSRLIETVRKVHEFQIAQAVATTLASIDKKYLLQIIELAKDKDPLLRRMSMDVLGRRGDPRGIGPLIGGLDDEDVYVRFQAAHSLQAFGESRVVADALMQSLSDPSAIVQNRAAVSLATCLIEDSTTAPRLGLESALRILKTPTGPLKNFPLNVTQSRALQQLSKKFREFGDDSARLDLAWGFRPIGNAILAFGAEGGKRLQEMIDQKKDRRLAELAWQILHIRQGMENFCLIPDEEEENARIYSTFPTRKIASKQASSALKYDPVDK